MHTPMASWPHTSSSHSAATEMLACLFPSKANRTNPHAMESPLILACFLSVILCVWLGFSRHRRQLFSIRLGLIYLTTALRLATFRIHVQNYLDMVRLRGHSAPPPPTHTPPSLSLGSALGGTLEIPIFVT